MKNAQDSNVQFSIIEAKWLVNISHRLFPESKIISSRQLDALFQLHEWPEVNENLSQKMAEKLLTEKILVAMNLRVSGWKNTIDETMLPALILLPIEGWCVVTGTTTDGGWQIECPGKRFTFSRFPDETIFAPLMKETLDYKVGNGAALHLFRHAILKHKRFFFWAALAALAGNVLALAGSLYSMQVYDRVLPTQNGSTLFVLAIGALLAAFTEFIVKLGRHGVTEYAISSIDVNLSGRIYRRLLNIRMDQFPTILGTLSSQIRSYETIRVFMTTAILYAFLDAPFALLFLIVIGLIAGPIVAVVPVIFIIIALLVGFYLRARITEHAKKGNEFSNRRQGMLVETIQNIETIKALGVNEQFATRWHIQEQYCTENNRQSKQLSDLSNFFTAFIQQSSYISLVSVGAWVVITNNTLTSGALIASSILAGRVLAPVAALPGLIVQWAHAKAALEGLENIFALEGDNNGVTYPLTPESITGEYELSYIRFSWPDRSDILRIDNLNIKAGERVAILGGVGSGKSSLLRLLAGLYRPVEGTVLLDGLDIQQIGRNHLSEKIGYMPQESRLFAGSLRDNLLAGLYDITEARLAEVCRLTGLDRVVASHPRGLGLKISEGGSGLSGGQKQQVALSRMLLGAPDVWLLDEPTSAMDDSTETHCLNALKEAVGAGKTLVLVTHKPKLLVLIDRIIIIGPQGIIADGPKDIILQPRSSSSAPEAPRKPVVAFKSTDLDDPSISSPQKLHRSETK